MSLPKSCTPHDLKLSLPQLLVPCSSTTTVYSLSSTSLWNPCIIIILPYFLHFSTIFCTVSSAPLPHTAVGLNIYSSLHSHPDTPLAWKNILPGFPPHFWGLFLVPVRGFLSFHFILLLLYYLKLTPLLFVVLHSKTFCISAPTYLTENSFPIICPHLLTFAISYITQVYFSW